MLYVAAAWVVMTSVWSDGGGRPIWNCVYSPGYSNTFYSLIILKLLFLVVLESGAPASKLRAGLTSMLNIL